MNGYFSIHFQFKYLKYVSVLGNEFYVPFIFKRLVQIIYILFKRDFI